MRFTTSKEARDPDAHLRCCPEDSLLICRKEISEVLLKFVGYNILFKFLTNIFIFNITDFNDALQVTIDRFDKHILDFHDISPH